MRSSSAHVVFLFTPEPFKGSVLPPEASSQSNLSPRQHRGDGSLHDPTDGVRLRLGDQPAEVGVVLQTWDGPVLVEAETRPHTGQMDEHTHLLAGLDSGPVLIPVTGPECGSPPWSTGPLSSLRLQRSLLKPETLALLGSKPKTETTARGCSESWFHTRRF